MCQQRNNGTDPTRRALIAAALAGVFGARALRADDDGYQLVTPPIQRVGSRLACLCGVCKNTVGDCAMLGCEYCAPTRGRIAKWQSEGKSDDEIVAMVVKENGLKALASPPASGFSLLAWWMPVVAILAGLAVVLLFLRRMTAKPVAAGPGVEQPDLDRYRQQIEKDLAKLE